MVRPTDSDVESRKGEMSRDYEMRGWMMPVLLEIKSNRRLLQDSPPPRKDNT